MASYFSTITPFREMKGTFVLLIPSKHIIKGKMTTENLYLNYWNVTGLRNPL